jgi:hypothetical protein
MSTRQEDAMTVPPDPGLAEWLDSRAGRKYLSARFNLCRGWDKWFDLKDDVHDAGPGSCNHVRPEYVDMYPDCPPPESFLII